MIFFNLPCLLMKYNPKVQPGTLFSNSKIDKKNDKLPVFFGIMLRSMLISILEKVSLK